MPVDIKYLEQSIFEAKRFLERASGCLEDMKTCKNIREKNKDGPVYIWPDQKKSAAVRRSSMDLTRALAELRKY